MRLELKVKSNGHNVCNKLIKSEVLKSEVEYYLTKYKLPINLYVSESKQIENSDQPKLSGHHSNQNGRSEHSEFEEEYDVSVLAEQVILFESDKQIDEYISTEKLLAHDVEEKLSKLSKALILVANQQFQSKREFMSIEDISKGIKEKNITKEELNSVEEKCMETLKKVQEERRKMELCVICWESMINVILLPCMHMVLCSKCCQMRSCPVCKAHVTSSSIVYK